MRSRPLLRLLRFYPPFVGAGIRIRRMTEDLREIDVEMKLRLHIRRKDAKPASG